VIVPFPTIQRPALHLADPARAETEWRAWAARTARDAPVWAYDPDHINGYALDILPRVCAEIGTGEALTSIARPAWWFWGGQGSGNVIVLRAKLGSRAVLCIDRATGEWDCPAASRRGETLVHLAAWRWRTTDAKAAWRLARICGLKRPLAA